MPFPRKLLNDNEDIVLDLRPHWWFLSGPVFATVLGVAATIVAAVLAAPEAVFWTLLAAAGLAVLWVVGRWLRWITTNFVLTTDRLIYRSGVLAKKGMEIPLERVNNIAFNQSVFERMLRSGDLVIESAGEQGRQPFTDIARPSQVQNEIYRQMEAANTRDIDRMAGRRDLSIPEQIEKLDELRQRGVLTQAEFEAKKAQLLDRL